MAKRPAAKKQSRTTGSTRADQTLAPYRARIRRACTLLKRSGHDALLITNTVDIAYLTPFSGEDSRALLTDRSLFIITDFRFEEDAGHASPVAKIVMRDGDMTKALACLILDVDPKRLALQSDAITADERSRLAIAVGTKRLHDTKGLIAKLRVVKDEAEIGSIKSAIRIQEQALLGVLPTIRSGQSESSIAARLEMEMKLRGASGPSFQTIVAGRANSSKPHAVPGATKTMRGQSLLIDFGAKVGGYCSDLTRTFALGRWPKELGAIYEVVLEAQLAAIAAIRPGVTGREVDAVARGIIEEAGYGPRFGHGLGHGIGLNIHEDPRLSKLSDDVLEAGMVVTVEPGVYIPGLGGVRIEDDILITERGTRVLSTLPKDLKWATL